MLLGPYMSVGSYRVVWGGMLGAVEVSAWETVSAILQHEVMDAFAIQGAIAQQRFPVRPC